MNSIWEGVQHPRPRKKMIQEGRRKRRTTRPGGIVYQARCEYFREKERESSEAQRDV